MVDRARWIDTTGGPHLLLAEELVPSWRGFEGWRGLDPLDQSDYARACRAGENWLGVIPCGDGQAMILGGHPGQVAWLPIYEGAGGVLVQGICADDENQLLDAAVGSLATDALNGSDVETADLCTGDSGVLRLFDASEPGDDLLGDSQILALRPGRYRVRAAYVERERFAMVVREIAACS